MAKKHSKRYNGGLKVADLTKDYPLKEAVEILSKFPKAKFDETVELSFRLGVDAASGEQNVRGTTPLPNGSGKKVRVLVFTDDPQKALAAGADFAGLQDMMQKVNEGWLDFDVAIATTEAMKQVRTLARVLGPKGLMPNPKAGTVTDDIVAGIKAVKAGRVEFKMDKTANIGSAWASALLPTRKSSKMPPRSLRPLVGPSRPPSRAVSSSRALPCPRA